jgi:hypothetical protein
VGYLADDTFENNESSGLSVASCIRPGMSKFPSEGEFLLNPHGNRHDAKQRLPEFDL